MGKYLGYDVFKTRQQGVVHLCGAVVIGNEEVGIKVAERVYACNDWFVGTVLAFVEPCVGHHLQPDRSCFPGFVGDGL